MKRVTNIVNYKNADKCHKCPGKNGPDGCPWWWTVKQKCRETQEERIIEECGKAHLPEYMDFIAEMSARPAAEFNAMRQQIHDYVQEGFKNLAKGMIESVKQIEKGEH